MLKDLGEPGCKEGPVRGRAPDDSALQSGPEGAAERCAIGATGQRGNWRTKDEVRAIGWQLGQSTDHSAQHSLGDQLSALMHVGGDKALGFPRKRLGCAGARDPVTAAQRCARARNIRLPCRDHLPENAAILALKRQCARGIWHAPAPGDEMCE